MTLRSRQKQKLKRGRARNGYNVSSSRAPVAMSTRMDYVEPRISSRSRKQGMVQCTIRHREFISSISGSVNFVDTAFAVQPGLSSTFPWLASMAINWENYHMNAIQFRYVSRSSTAFTGSVIMAPDYDSSDSQPTTYQEISTFQNSISDAPWKDIVCRLSPRSTMLVGQNRYIRSGPLGPNQDVKLYDIAVLNLATVGQSDTAVIGELWVEYNVTLLVPNVQVITQVSNLSSGQVVGATNFATTALMGTVQAGSSGNVVITFVGNVVTLTNLSIGSRYQLTYILAANTTITTAPTMTNTSGFASFANQYGQTNGTTSAACVYVGESDNSIAQITLGGVTVLVGGTSGVFEVSASEY